MLWASWIMILVSEWWRIAFFFTVFFPYFEFSARWVFLNFPYDVFLFICYCFQKAVIYIACLIRWYKSHKVYLLFSIMRLWLMIAILAFSRCCLRAPEVHEALISYLSSVRVQIDQAVVQKILGVTPEGASAICLRLSITRSTGRVIALQCKHLTTKKMRCKKKVKLVTGDKLLPCLCFYHKATLEVIDAEPNYAEQLGN